MQNTYIRMWNGEEACVTRPASPDRKNQAQFLNHVLHFDQVLDGFTWLPGQTTHLHSALNITHPTLGCLHSSGFLSCRLDKKKMAPV